MNDMGNMSRKKRIILISIIIVLVVSLVVAGTYALWTWNSNVNKNKTPISTPITILEVVLKPINPVNIWTNSGIRPTTNITTDAKIQNNEYLIGNFFFDINLQTIKNNNIDVTINKTFKLVDIISPS